MPPKSENTEKVPTLKGAAAEAAVLDYVTKCNRPYGAADVSANIKNVVSKPATQKILLALSEKGVITQKTYGKQTFFVAKQSDGEDLPADKVEALERELVSCNEKIKTLTASNKSLAFESTQIRLTPTDADLPGLINSLEFELERLNNLLAPYRAKFVELPTEAEIEKIDSDWARWREEWKKRKKLFKEIWSTASETMTPDQAAEAVESMGIEFDSEEHELLERGPLCQPPARFKTNTKLLGSGGVKR